MKQGNYQKKKQEIGNMNQTKPNVMKQRKLPKNKTIQ